MTTLAFLVLYSVYYAMLVPTFVSLKSIDVCSSLSKTEIQLTHHRRDTAFIQITQLPRKPVEKSAHLNECRHKNIYLSNITPDWLPVKDRNVASVLCISELFRQFNNPQMNLLYPKSITLDGLQMLLSKFPHRETTKLKTYTSYVAVTCMSERSMAFYQGEHV
uniref:Uncharacterized protein n=1 Tax=Glossina pallidipes TaxID=7398 RepID=A0A1A9ZAM6_GLOPL